MIQELLLGVSCSSANFIPTPPDSKFSIINSHNNGLVPPPPPPTTTTTTTSTVASAAAATSSNPENQNLRCPRCDSSNTKFCYYNNYNLTQPRHFCKTCRRYWTKGGALRNVPIGGGCRKNKSVSGSGIGIISSSVAKSSAKIKTVSSSSSPSPGGGGGLDHPHHQEVPAGSPILWGSPQNSQLLALLRASHGQNPNPSPSPSHSLCLSNPMMSNNNNAMGVSVKEEGCLMVSSHMVGTTEPMGCSNNGSPGFDPTGSFWRSNQDFHQQQHQNMGFVVGEHHQNSSGIQELYQRLRSSCSDDSSSRLFLGNMASSSSSSSSPSSSSLAILESGPILGGGLGYWNNNQPLSGWSDLPTTNGASAYP